MKTLSNPEIKAQIILKILTTSQAFFNRHGSMDLLILALLDHGELSAAHIARILGYPRQTVHHALKKMTTDKLCEYNKNYFHIKSRLLKITPKGKAQLEKEKKKFSLTRCSIDRLTTAVLVLESLSQ